MPSTLTSSSSGDLLSPDSIAGFAAVLADRSRVAICLALLDGRAWTAGELARHVGVAPSTASEHLTVLVGSGLLTEERQGRSRYVRLADARAAQLIEDLAAAVGESVRPTSLRASGAARRLQAARTCYDHLAGVLGVSLFDALADNGLLEAKEGLALTESGRAWFIDLIGPDALQPRGSRPLLRTCVDWTERRTHLGGSLGASLCTELLDRKWIVRAQQHRGITVTSDGAAALRSRLGLDLESRETTVA
jgi:DNA-binding transcriptional ArsR family regulator